MWEDSAHDFAQRHRLTLKQSALFQSTAEHLTPVSDGGRDVPENIVAACTYCNAQRHRRRVPLSAPAYEVYVLRRVAARKWHASMLLGASRPPVAGDVHVRHLRPAVIRPDLAPI